MDVAINKAIKTTLAYRLWQLVSGLLSLLFVTSFYSAETQGYYFTFISLLTIQTIFELGITSVIMTVTAHEMASASWNPLDNMPPPSDLALRLSGLVHVIWQRISQLVIGFVVVASAFGFFVMHTEEGVSQQEWLVPWVLVVVLYGLKISITVFEGLLEGMAQVEFVARTRLFSSIAFGLVLWLAIFTGAGLFALAISATFSIVVSLLVYRRNFLALALRLYRLGGYTLVTEVWCSETKSFQTRMAISWICGYAVFQTLVPIAFHYSGPAEAGRVGLALSMTSAMLAIGSAWIGPKAPEISRLSKEGRFEALKVCLRRMLIAVGLVNLFLSLLIVIGYELVPVFSTRMLDRLPNASTLLILLGATLLNQYITIIATFTRSFKKDPFVWPTAISAFVSVFFGMYLTKIYGTTGTAAAYGISLLSVLFPFSAYCHVLLESSGGSNLEEDRKP